MKFAFIILKFGGNLRIKAKRYKFFVIKISRNFEFRDRKQHL